MTDEKEPLDEEDQYLDWLLSQVHDEITLRAILEDYE